MTVQKKGIMLRNQNNVFQWTEKTKRKIYKSVISILNNQRDIAFKKVKQAAIRRGFLEISRNENQMKKKKRERLTDQKDKRQGR